ncbi:MAG: heat-shock protein [Cyanobacteria bacterium P01_E01_bin.42]
MKFNTVEEVTNWRSFTLDDTVYDLSHLDAKWVEYLDEKDRKNPKSYRFIVTYGLHCFTKEAKELSQEQSQLLMYSGPKESRHFNLERYELSKQLPSIIESLGKKETLICHAGNNNYAIIKILDSNDKEVNYFVPFVVFREKKKLRLHVQSAYPLDEARGRVKKVRFFTIANSLLYNKKLPTPPK